MSDTLQDLQRRLRSAEDLHSVVRTMKALAAVSIRQYEESVRALKDYTRTVEVGLRAVLLRRTVRRSDAATGEAVVFLFGSDQGMVGQFNETVIEEAGRVLKEIGSPAGGIRFWVAGSRLASGLEERFGPPEEFFPLPASSRAISETVRDVLIRFEKRRRGRAGTPLSLIFNAPLPGASYALRSLRLLPPDERWLEELGGRRWIRKGLPHFFVPGEELFSALIGEYLFVSIFRSFAASMAAENAARLAAMQRAEKNIEEMREDLLARYHSQRQTAITEELFDVISGFEALTTGREKRRAGDSVEKRNL